MRPEFRQALACAHYFRSKGLTVFPSRTDQKAPMLPGHKFTHHFGGDCGPVPVPDELFEPDQWATTNLQIVTGTQHAGTLKLCVIDLDGEEAQETWGRICAHHEYQPEGVWVVESGSGTGKHLYYRLPDDATECRSGILWGIWDTWGRQGKGDWQKHKEIRLFGDRTQIIAPPSIHVETGQPYQFVPGGSPRDVGLPALVPGWLLAMPRLSSPRVAEAKARVIPDLTPRAPGAGLKYRREVVLEAVSDKVSVAEGWGLRFASRQANPSGWLSCYAFDRPDERRPSAMFSETTGGYIDFRDGRTRQDIISFFDLGAMIRPEFGGDWRACRDWCGDRYMR